MCDPFILPIEKESSSHIKGGKRETMSDMTSTKALAFEPLRFGGVTMFTTLYDPSDLPGTSVDPLGFERGYVALADVLLPGMTTITETPRYLSMIAGGITLAQAVVGDEPHTAKSEEKVLEIIQRMERLWAVSSVLFWNTHPEATSGDWGSIRGITYAEHQLKLLLESGSTHLADLEFQFLRQQRLTGGLGTYRSLMESAGLLFSGEWRLTPDLGVPLGEMFIESTGGSQVKKAIVYGEPVSVARLIRWGEKAHPAARMLSHEQELLREGMLQGTEGTYRACTFCLLRESMSVLEETGVVDAELKTMQEMDRIIRSGKRYRKIPDEISTAVGAALRIIPAYETVYRVLSLAFERILWLVKRTPGGLPADQIQKDRIVRRAAGEIKTSCVRLEKILSGESSLPKTTHDSIKDAVDAVRASALTADNTGEFVRSVIARHKDVQNGKFDKGRRKSAWVVEEGGFYRLTFSRPGGLSREVSDAAEIGPHPYRLYNALRFLRALNVKP